MKLRPLVQACAGVLGLVVVISVFVSTGASVAGCGHRQHGEWRGPAQPLPCNSDADCHGGTCAIEPGATQGTCASAPSMTDADGGDPSQEPGPLVQPSPNDIKL